MPTQKQPVSGIKNLDVANCVLSVGVAPGTPLGPYWPRACRRAVDDLKESCARCAVLSEIGVGGTIIIGPAIADFTVLRACAAEAGRPERPSADTATRPARAVSPAQGQYAVDVHLRNLSLSAVVQFISRTSDTDLVRARRAAHAGVPGP